MQRSSVEAKCIGFEPSLYEPWVPLTSGVECSRGSVPLFVRRSDEAPERAKALVFLDRLTLAYLELATVLAKADDQENVLGKQSSSPEALI